VASQARSGLTVAAFCRRERLNAWTFYRWRTRLGGMGRTRARHERASRPSPFVDLGAVLSSPSSSSSVSRRELRLELSDGIVLTVVRG
jgi:hypothetical protein